MISQENPRLKVLAIGFISEFIEGRKTAYSTDLLKSRMGYLRQLGLSGDELVILMQCYAMSQDKKDVNLAIDKMRRLLNI